MYHDVSTINHNPIIRIQAVNTAKKRNSQRWVALPGFLKKVYIIYLPMVPGLNNQFFWGTNFNSTLAIFVKLLAPKRYPQIAA